jgi:hypothetical protein
MTQVQALSADRIIVPALAPTQFSVTQYGETPTTLTETRPTILVKVPVVSRACLLIAMLRNKSTIASGGQKKRDRNTLQANETSSNKGKLILKPVRESLTSV